MKDYLTKSAGSCGVQAQKHFCIILGQHNRGMTSYSVYIKFNKIADISKWHHQYGYLYGTDFITAPDYELKKSPG